jgi:hypothetical protein
MGSKRIKQLKVEAIANGSKRLIDGLKGTTTNTKFITLSSPLQTAALTTPRGGIISLALTANTLKFVNQASSIPKMATKPISCS